MSGIKKHYDKQFIESHRSQWNEYQASYKVKKRFQQVEQIRQQVRDLNICGDSELTFKAAVIFFVIVELGIKKPSAIAYRTEVNIFVVNRILDNWVNNGLYDGKTFYLDTWETELEFIFEITLLSMAGAGEVKCLRVPAE